MQRIHHTRTSGVNIRKKNFHHKSYTLMWAKHLLSAQQELRAHPAAVHTSNPPELRNHAAPRGLLPPWVRGGGATHRRSRRDLQSPSPALQRWLQLSLRTHASVAVDDSIPHPHCISVAFRVPFSNLPFLKSLFWLLPFLHRKNHCFSQLHENKENDEVQLKRREIFSTPVN